MTGAPSELPPSTGPLPPGALVLAFDGVSPAASAALARDGALLTDQIRVEGRSSGVLLDLIAAALRAMGATTADLAALVALRGPGSFTGTRVTLATAAGLRLAGVPRATAVSNLEALALVAPMVLRRPLAAVDALRGEWFLQPFAAGFDGPTALAEPAIVAAGAPPPTGPDGVVGFGLAALRRRWPELPGHEPAGLAGAVAVAASRGRWPWDADRLARPIYLRPPATHGTS